MSVPSKTLSRLRHHAHLLSTSAASITSTSSNITDASDSISRTHSHSYSSPNMTPPTTTSSTHRTAAPWRAPFLAHTAAMPSPEFVLSTISHTPSANVAHTLEPRARFCVFRGMWGSLPANKHNGAPRNAGGVESDCVTFTTDVRMAKCRDFFLRLDERGEGERASGGGAPVEAVWWVNEDKVKTQWRVRGDVWVLGPDFGSERETEGVQRVKSAVEPRMRATGDGTVDEFDWAKEITAHFGNLSPGMRGSFKNPPPGKPVEDTPDANDKLIGELIDELDDKEARDNFRVVIIRPFRVESTDLIEPREARRQEYVFDDVSLQWQHKTLWP